MNFTLLTRPGPVMLVVFPAYPPDSRHPADRAVVGVTMTGVQATSAGTGRVCERSTCG
jgi:hypothetical protein